MSVIPYISKPVLNSGICRNFEIIQGINTSVGFMQYKLVEETPNSKYLIPVRFLSSTGASSIEFKETGTTIKLFAKKTSVTLSPELTRESINTVAQQLVKNEQIQNCYLALRRDLLIATVEAVALSRAVLPVALADQVFATSLNISTYTLPQRELQCIEEAVITTVNEQVVRWVDVIKTAGQQLSECVSSCGLRPFYEVPICIAVCAAKSFIDIVVGTYQVIETIAKQIVTYVTHCVATNTIPLPVGRINPGIIISPVTEIGAHSQTLSERELEATLSPFRKILECAANGDWNIWKVNISSIGVKNALPVGVEVCFDKACADSIKDSLTLQTLFGIGAVIADLVNKGEATLKMISAVPFLNAGITKIATAAGLTLAQTVSVFLALVALISYHYLFIIGQIHLLEKQGKIQNGICLKHPLFLITAGAVVTTPTIFGPFIITQVGVHVPVIVTPR